MLHGLQMVRYRVSETIILVPTKLNGFPTKGDMEALGSFTARAVDALAQEGYCVIQLPLSLGPRELQL